MFLPTTSFYSFFQFSTRTHIHKRTHNADRSSWRLIATRRVSHNRRVLKKFPRSRAVCEIEWKVKCEPELETGIWSAAAVCVYRKGVCGNAMQSLLNSF